MNTLTKACALILVVLTSSCYKHSEERTIYGRFEVTDRMITDLLRFEGGNTRTDGASICSLEHPDFCIHSKRSLAIGHSGMPDPNFLVVFANGKTWILDAKRGVPVDMASCSSYLPSDKGGRTLNGDWTSDQRVKIVAFMSASGRISIVEFNFADPHTPLCQIVHTYDQSSANCTNCEEVEVDGMKFGESDDVIAWLYCNPGCSLDSFNLVSREFARKDIGCTSSAELGVRWRRLTPEVVHLAEARHPNLKLACVDEHGVARFRFEKYVVGANEYPDWLARAQTGEFDNEPLPRRE